MTADRPPARKDPRIEDPCTCASDGSARRCPWHTQEDFEAADRARRVSSEREPGLGEVIARTSNGSLLTTFAALTHRMHSLHGTGKDIVRGQRDRVQAEILRRMG